VQLEGLTMDRHFLDNIRERRELIQVLQGYEVNYYVSTNPRRVDGCYVCSEPAKQDRAHHE